jgi:nucleoside phosphorylase
MTVLLVPRGAEERAVRRGAPGAAVVAIPAGARAAVLPAEIPPGPIVVLGLCGALRGVRTGDAVLYRDAVDEAGRYTFDRELVGALHAALPALALVSACTVDRVVTRAAERAALAAAYGADVVDMETTHVARALALRGRPSLVVRVASDDPSRDLPPIENAIDAGGAIRPLHLARAFAAQPLAAGRFVRDVRGALRVLTATARAVSRMA